MSLPPLRSSPKGDTTLSQLATFLSGRREQITASWLEGIRQNPRVKSADDLDDDELADHLPILFDDLAGVLRGDTPAAAVARDAESHGQHRWQQDYHLPELTRELSIACRLVLELGLDAFEDAHPAAPRPELRRARECILRFFEDTAAGSVRRYVQKQRERVEALHEQLREADRALTAAAQAERDGLRQLADVMPQIVWAAEADGHMNYFNRQWHDYTGVDPVSAGREAWESALHPEDLPPVTEAWAAAVASGEPYELKFRLRRASDGAYRWFLGRARSVRDAGGTVVRWIGTDTDIHDFEVLQAQNEQLLASERAARVEAERASRVKDEFLSTLSHELRTPLNAIVGWAHLLGSGGLRDARDLEEGLVTIERNAHAQTRIVDDLLDMSSILAGKVRLEVRRMDLVPVLEAALASVRFAAEAKGISLQAAWEDGAVPPVRGDPDRLQQVFWNILGNAIKFTPRGGRVRVALTRVNESLEVSVTDTGEGIAPEFLPHVFERFSQADASSRRRHGGLGLGLAIVRQLVELHGGTVRVQSAGLAQGASFHVSLPLPEPRPADAASVAAAPDGLRSAKEPSPTAREQLTLEGVRILVVDDEPDARTLMKRLLEGFEANVWTVSSAAQAMELMREEQFDVLVSDLGMPGEDGYAFIRRVRDLDSRQGGNIPALAVTAYARPEDRFEAIKAGFQMYLTKPVNPLQLLMWVASLAERRCRF